MVWKQLSKLKIQKQFDEDNIIKNIRNFFKLKKEDKVIKDRTIRDIRTFFEQEEDSYKIGRVGNFGTTIMLNMKVTLIKNKNISATEYLNKVKPYLKDIVTDLQLTIAVNFISSKYTNEEQVMHLKSDNIEVVTYDNRNEDIK